MRRRLYDTGDFKIYYPDDGKLEEKEDKLELFYSLIKFITIGSIICFTIASIMFQLL